MNKIKKKLKTKIGKFKNKVIKNKEKFRFILNINFNSRRINYIISKALIYLGFNYRAEEYLVKCISKKELDKYIYSLGSVYKKQRKWLLSIEMFEKLEKSNYEKEEYLKAYAQSLMAMDRYSKSVGIWRKYKNNRGLLSKKELFEYGLCLEKSNELEEANQIFNILLEYENENKQKLGIGYIFEKKGNWYLANKYYVKRYNSINDYKDLSELLYRLALSYDRLFDFNNAKKYIEMALVTKKNAIWYARLGYINENLALWDEATQAYKEAINYSFYHESSYYYRVGYLLQKQSKYEEAADYFKNQKIYQKEYKVSRKSINKNIKKMDTSYAEFYKSYKIEDDIIIYESSSGKDITGNPYALFKEIKKDYNFRHYWVIRKNTIIPEKMRSMENVYFVYYNTEKYVELLSKAKYLITSHTFPWYFIRKKEQVYLNTWHGTPIKHMGIDIKNDAFMNYKNISRNFLHCTHFINQSKFSEKIMLKSHTVSHTAEMQKKITGYPRVDITINMSDEEKNDIRERYNVKKNDKIVLYAPTWRGIYNKARDETSFIIDTLEYLNEIEDVTVIFRGHEQVANKFRDLEIENIVIANDIDCNELLSVVDILITDYSSIFFDFLPVNKPIIYFAYDYNEYIEERGLYFKLEEITDLIVKNKEDLKKIVEDNVKEPKVSLKQIQAKEKYCSMDDGSASKRVINFMFNENKNEIIKRKKKILLFGGNFNTNGITTSFVNLINSINKDIYDVTILVIPRNIKDVKYIDLYKDDDIDIVSGFGRKILTIEEGWVERKIEVANSFINEEYKKRFDETYEREYIRLLGYTKFDAVIDFESYNAYITNMFANSLSINKIVFLHNNMFSEMKVKYKSLNRTFEIYKNFDKVVSVSKMTSDLNKANLSEIYNIDSSKFEYFDNIQDYKKINDKSNEKLEVEEDYQIFGDNKVFIAIGRLSLEKDHEKLIRAFRAVVKKNNKVKLIILGVGPLKSKLITIINNFKLTDNVYLLGRRENPYPYIKMSDCFISSSNHEGQPMTLFEALILDKPIIATDIIGNRSVLEDRGGFIVDNSIKGLELAMLDYLDNKLEINNNLDIIKYNENSMDHFYSEIINK